MTTPLPKTRLGKRSPMGALVIAPCHMTELLAMSTAPPHITPEPRPVSCCIDVPKSYRSPESVDMDEMMAAMVLTSLSCSPIVQSPPQRDPATAPACRMECSGGELSDSGSSGYWSWDRGSGSPVPSPPIAETDSLLAPPPDEGLDMEMEQVLFDEPAPRKRKNSVKVAYRCLWPNCGKILTSVVGIKRHIRTLHLGHSSEPEQSRREEDFYYTEILLEMDPTAPPAALPAVPSAALPANPGARWTSCTSPPSPAQQAAAGPGPRTPEPAAPGVLQPSLLSQSAPSCFWQVRSEHSYQACPPVQVLASPVSCPWTPPAAVLNTAQVAPFRSRSISVGEQWLQQQNTPSRHHPAAASPPRSHCASRRARGEAKKCRKVYGIEHRDQWCTACRWKKACQRFLD
ncbi:zinc finger protein 395-like [Anguilla rostrata]|uniref:zinc finger protein 395-like n=1 Tax=Anguilla rostrata TaxID=7938 RepID=UPI0030D59337